MKKKCTERAVTKKVAMRHNATQNFSNEHETIRKYNRSALAPMSQKWQAKKRVVERWRRKTTKRFLRPDTRAAIKGRHKKAPTRIVAEGQTEVKSSRWRCYLQMMHSYSSVLFFFFLHVPTTQAPPLSLLWCLCAGGCGGCEALKNCRGGASRHSVFDETIDVMLGSMNTGGDLKHVRDAQKRLLGVSIGHHL